MLGRPLDLVFPDLGACDAAAVERPGWDDGAVTNGLVVTAARRDGTRMPVWAAVVARESMADVRPRWW